MKLPFTSEPSNANWSRIATYLGLSQADAFKIVEGADNIGAKLRQTMVAKLNPYLEGSPV